MTKISLAKRPCIRCQSSDALQPYQQDDGRITGWCFSCQKWFNLDGKVKKEFKKNNMLAKEEVLTFSIRGENERGIYKETNQRYGIRYSVNGSTGERDTDYYPYYIDRKLCGFKMRVLPKDFESPTVGSIKNADLFGWHLLDFSYKRIFITEGEEDAVTIAQVLWEHYGKRVWPNVVSLANGAGIGRSIDKFTKRLNKFDKIIACFDNDEHGQKALIDLSLKVDIKKLYVMKLSEKDANDCLRAGKKQEIVDAFLKPTQFRPHGVVNIRDLKDVYFSKDTSTYYKFPESWKLMNAITYGMKVPALDIFTSDTSNGKTQLCRELVVHLLKTTKEKIGCIFLEESSEDTLRGLGSLVLDQRITLPDVMDKVPQTDLERSWDAISKDDRIEFRRSEWNKIENNSVLSAIRFMAEGADCKFIFLDHLSIVVSADADRGQERERIDTLMTNLKSMAMQMNIWIGVVVHLRKVTNQGTPFERGGLATGDDLRGSGGLKQLSNQIYFIQRNRMHSQESMRNVLRLHVIKNRTEGSCGPMDYLEFKKDTGRIVAIAKPEYTIIEKDGKGRTPNVEEDF